MSETRWSRKLNNFTGQTDVNNHSVTHGCNSATTYLSEHDHFIKNNLILETQKCQPFRPVKETNSEKDRPSEKWAKWPTDSEKNTNELSRSIVLRRNETDDIKLHGVKKKKPNRNKLMKALSWSFATFCFPCWLFVVCTIEPPTPDEPPGTDFLYPCYYDGRSTDDDYSS